MSSSSTTRSRNNVAEGTDTYEALRETKRLEEVEVDVIKAAPERNSQTASSELSSENQRALTAELDDHALASFTTVRHSENDRPISEIPSVKEMISRIKENASEAEASEAAGEVIDISKMVIGSREEAQRIAGIILERLEEDLYEAKEQGWFSEKDLPLTASELEIRRRRMWLRNHFSNLSLVSNLSDLPMDLDQPSTMNLTYERGRNMRPNHRLQKLKEDQKVDESVQVDFHRADNAMSVKGAQSDYTQTKEFALLRRDHGRQAYMKMYPVPDDWPYASLPSREGSLQEMLHLAQKHDPSDDIIKVGPKPSYKKSSKERLLQPFLAEDCPKVESYWTGSTYTGDFQEKMFSKGTYDFPTMAKYSSEFKEGHLHSSKHYGCITYPRGDTFEGTWRKGRFTDGKITFADGLQFEPMGWKYCTPPDRRFHIERTHGVQAVGQTLYSNRLPPPYVPHGSYDVGDGIYNPTTGLVINYEGIVLREATEYEHRWIVLNCRKRKFLTETYEPSFMKERPPDSYAYFCPKNT